MLFRQRHDFQIMSSTNFVKIKIDGNETSNSLNSSQWRSLKSISNPKHYFILHLFYFFERIEERCSFKVLQLETVMRCSEHGQFLFYFILFSDFIGILFSFFFSFWIMKRHVTLQSHDMSHNVMSQAQKVIEGSRR